MYFEPITSQNLAHCIHRQVFKRGGWSSREAVRWGRLQFAAFARAARDADFPLLDSQASFYSGLEIGLAQIPPKSVKPKASDSDLKARCLDIRHKIETHDESEAFFHEGEIYDSLVYRNSDGTYAGGEVCIAWGGPNIWLISRRGAVSVEGAWGRDQCEYAVKDDRGTFAAELESILDL